MNEKGFIYIEFVSRRPGVPLSAFREIVGNSRWASEYERDRVLLNLGRTWRIGPEPEYITVWYTPEAGIERLDEWEPIFSGGDASAVHEPYLLSARIDSAGCYEALLAPILGAGGPYYAEYFDFASEASQQEVVAYFETRRRKHPGVVLNLLVDRIGMLGPDPRGIVVWSAKSYLELESLIRGAHSSDSPVVARYGGLYADIGAEII